MKYLSVLIAVLLLPYVLSSTLKNTTDFFNRQVGYNLTFESYSGYQDIDWYELPNTASIYYSLFQANKQKWQDHSIPLIIWLQGGPGSSSQFGCFNQIGPLYIDGVDKFQVMENSWSWNFFGHVMCVDQPIGTGFSFNRGKTINNTYIAAKHFVNFLYNFFKNNKYQLWKNPLYIAGESYAGHFIPAICKEILSNSSLGFNLQGIMMGDAYIDPLLQVNNFDSYAYAVGVVSNKWRDTARFLQNQALVRILKGDYFQASNYTNFLFYNETVRQIYYNGMSLVNYRIYDDGYVNNNYGIFLQQNKKQFGVSDSINFVDQNWDIYYSCNADLSMSFRGQFQFLLDKGLRVLIYNGQNDYTVPTSTVLTLLNHMKWKNADNWKKSTKATWKEEGKILGWIKKFENLAFVIVRDAGHYVSADQSKSAWYMINNFLRKLW